MKNLMYISSLILITVSIFFYLLNIQIQIELVVSGFFLIGFMLNLASILNYKNQKNKNLFKFILSF